MEKSDLWWLGPEWLRGPKEGWPERQEIEETPESTEEQKKAAVSTVKVSETVSIENVIDVHRYSSREKLVRMTAWIQRFAQNCKAKIRKTDRMTGGLTVEEIVSAEKLWIQTVQAGLKERTSFSQLVSQLGLVESEGVLYCKWRREYLTDLREYHRGKCESQVRTVSIGDVVIVFEENVKRGLWKIGKVEEVIRGRDGVVRGAKVKVMTKGKPVLLNRPVQKLYPLEVRTETLKSPVGAEQDDNKTGGEVNGRETVVGVRGTPRRPVALDAGWKCRLMLDSDSS